MRLRLKFLLLAAAYMAVVGILLVNINPDPNRLDEWLPQTFGTLLLLGFLAIVVFLSWGVFQMARYTRDAPKRRRAARRARGECIMCGYSLKGNASGTCPECGTESWLPDADL